MGTTNFHQGLTAPFSVFAAAEPEYRGLPDPTLVELDVHSEDHGDEVRDLTAESLGVQRSGELEVAFSVGGPFPLVRALTRRSELHFLPPQGRGTGCAPVGLSMPEAGPQAAERGRRAGRVVHTMRSVTTT